MPSKSTKKEKRSEAGEPRYPYTVAPKTLRRCLEIIPQKPKPPKVITSTLKTWGFKGGNDNSVLRVLKALDLLSSSGEPTAHYANYMKAGTGAAVLGRQIKNVYNELFQTVANPEKASNDELRNFFNINSGGSEGTIQYQVDTFKALAAYATFGNEDPLDQEEAASVGVGVQKSDSKEPVVRIDLHIHLPENKSKAEYDAILESIANHIYKLKK